MSEVINKIEVPEDGFEVHISKMNNGRYVVQILDTDVNQYFPTGKSFVEYEDALKYAKTLV